ncbi:VanZ family protein [Bacteroidota bacterium]
MLKLLTWLVNNPKKNVIISTIYFIIAVLFHNPVSDYIHTLYKKYTFKAFSYFIIIFSLVIFILLIIYLVNYILKHQSKLRTVIYTLFTTLLMYFAFDLLISYNSELIHYPQYAILFVLIFPFNRRFVETIIICSLFSVVDELYQFIVLKGLYFDFNDLLLNFIGASLGAVTVYILTGSQAGAHLVKTAEYKLKQFLFSKSFSIALILLAVTVILFLTNVFGYWADDNAVINICRELNHDRSYWQTKPAGGNWHILYPLEGAIILYVLPFLYLGLDIKNYNK